MRSKKAEPGRPSLHQTFASGGRPFLPPRATPLRFFRRAFLQKKAAPPHLCSCALPPPYNSVPPVAEAIRARQCPFLSLARSRGIRRRNGRGGGCRIHTFAPPVWRDHAAQPFFAAVHLQVFRQAFLQKGRYLPRRSARAGLPPSASAAHLTPSVPATSLLFCPPAGRSSPPGRNRTRRTDFPQVPTRAVGTRIFCTLPALPRGGFCPAAYAGFSPGLFAKRPSSPRAAPTAGLAQQNRHNRKKAASVPETAFSGAKIPRSRIKVRSAGSRRQSVSASPPTHR